MDRRWAVAAFLVTAGAEGMAQSIPLPDMVLQACVESTFRGWSPLAGPVCVFDEGSDLARNGRVALERAVEGVNYDGGYSDQRSQANRAREEALGYRIFNPR